MLRLSFISGLVLATAIPVSAQGVEPRVHEMCSEAKDYAGCVRAMTTDISAPPVQRVINSRGADIAEGNQCPSGFAYVGGGNCMEVKCDYPYGLAAKSLGHDQRVAGKPGWGCKSKFGLGAGILKLEGTARASMNANCPPGEPKIGYNSTCTISALTINDNGRKANTSDWNDDDPLNYVPHEEL